MSFSRTLLSSSLLAGVVFSAATLPMAAMGSQPLTVHLENQPIFAGQFKELSGPYLGLATAVSLGAGVTSLALLSWSQSSRKLSKIEDEVSELRQQLKDKENELESLRFSDTRLASAGLASFLDEIEVASPAAELLQHSLAQVEAEQRATVSVSRPAELTSVELVKRHAAPAKAVQPASLEATVESVSQALKGMESPAQIDDLLNHLKQMMSQMEDLKADKSTQKQQARFTRVPNTVWQQQRLAS
jgi:DNA repair exonuclease SbcCD ATPase subunit